MSFKKDKKSVIITNSQPKWETLEERIKRHLRIPVKQKMEWLGQMLEFATRNKLALRRKLRSVAR